MSDASAPMWRPDPAVAAQSQAAAFARFCGARDGRRLDAWQDLHAWSVEDVGRFWTAFASWVGLRVDGTFDPATSGAGVAGTRFFPDVRLSFTEHVLDGRGADPADPAIIECHEAGAPRLISRAELRAAVATVAEHLESLGARAGDRVAAVVAHDADTVAVALACTGIGAAWSSCGPELATSAIVARFTQLDAKLLVVTAEHCHEGRTVHHAERAVAIASALPGLETVIFIGRGTAAAAEAVGRRLAGVRVVSLDPWLASARGGAVAWPRFPFDHPLYVLFSSGTTGAPKAIVHGQGGTLLEHLKEHILHEDLRAGDRLYFQTSCGWMMWHWTVSALATGAAIVTYDGSIAMPGPDALWRLAAATGVTVLGASPAFVHHARDFGVRPRAHAMPGLRAFLSTGSVLAERDFDWLAEELGPLPIHSISGGTDIIGCFVLGSPMLPVWRGDSPCVSLAMDVRALPSPDGGPDELVCATPFPSRPVAFLRDPDGTRLHEAYYAANPGLWTHGDFITLRRSGSARILGRADGVLKVRGIRIGPAEITDVVEAMPEVREAMAVEQRAAREPGGSRIVLLVVLADGVALDRGLVWRLKRAVRDAASADHVPAVIIDVPALPRTVNGKRSERAARDAVNGESAPNRDALRDPELLDLLRTHPGLRTE